MKRFLWWCVFAVLLGGAWILRGQIQDVWYAWNQPRLPAPLSHEPVVIASSSRSRAETKPVASSSTKQAVNELPASVNLAVPFLLQAPTHNWALPYQEACEEASAIMVDAYYRGRRERFGETEGNKAILDFIAFENKTFGYYKDTDTSATARVIREYFGYPKVFVQEVAQPDEIRRVLAMGYPVIAPFYGKALAAGNPYFRNGGPVYHMLVIKGYLADGRWIVNDPGIGKGADYIYTNEVLWGAIHDWNNGDVIRGAKKILTVLPK